MKLTELYSEYFANWISGGNLVSQDNISMLGLKPLFDRFITHDWITKVWSVRAFPVLYDINPTDLIRNEMFKLDPKVRTIINVVSEPVAVNVQSSLFMRQFENVSERYHKMKEFFDSLTEDQRVAGMSYTNPVSGRKVTIGMKDFHAVEEEYYSYLYVYEQVTAGHRFTNTYFFVQASARSKKAMRKFTRDLEALLSGQDIFFNELHGNIGTYLDNFCPASYKGSVPGKFSTMLMSDTNLAALLPYKTMGLIGGRGLLVAMDHNTGLPFIEDFFNSGTAQVFMICGKTGCGKTYLSFSLAIGLAGLGLHFSAVDIKGNEWVKVSKYVDTLVIGMSGNNAKFVNTLRLDDTECKTAEEAKEAYSTAVRGTVKLFEIAVALQEREGNTADLLSILNKAVAKVFSQAGVIEDKPVTFYNSRSLKYADVVDVVSVLQTSSSFTESQKMLCQLIITRTTDYFAADGRYSEAFLNELTLGDVLRSTAVIYDFNKNADVMLDTLDTLRVFMVQFLDGKKQSYRKKQKLHTAAFYEELQRCEKFGLLVDEISHKVTGSRSSNVIIFLLLNSVTAFDSSAFAAIKSNITTKMIGKMNREDVVKLIEEFDCEPISDYMMQISDDRTNELSHCFAVQYDTGVRTNKVLCETVMPAGMSEHFNTRDRMFV
ncbi:MAG: hypothetical protein K1W15_03185 [Lachnospiraceae bacterium]